MKLQEGNTMMVHPSSPCDHTGNDPIHRPTNFRPHWTNEEYSDWASKHYGWKVETGGITEFCTFKDPDGDWTEIIAGWAQWFWVR